MRDTRLRRGPLLFEPKLAHAKLAPPETQNRSQRRRTAADPMDLIRLQLHDLARELEGNRYLCVPKDRHAALHCALDAVEAILDSGCVRCGDCNQRMSSLEADVHECQGRFCRLQCGDCGESVDALLLDEHVCNGCSPGSTSRHPDRVPALQGQRRALSERGRGGPPYLLADVHRRCELLCLELAVVGGSALPWWEITTPDAHEELTRAVLEVRAVIDEHFIKCGDCGEMMTASQLADSAVLVVVPQPTVFWLSWAWLPWADSPGSWPRHAPGTSRRAAQGPMGNCGAALRPARSCRFRGIRPTGGGHSGARVRLPRTAAARSAAARHG